MSDGQEKKTTEQRWVTIEPHGRVHSQRYHYYRDCSFISNVADDILETVGERESRLLGLKPCSVCERRKTGGPAVDAFVKAITDAQGVIFAPGHTNPISEADKRDAAYNLLETLKGMGYYVAQRGAKK